MNVELLKKVQQHILEEPRRLDMLYGIKLSNSAPCGTVGCVAGWAAILSGKVDPKQYESRGFGFELPWWGNIESVALEELGLTSEQGGKLFYTPGWPEHLYEKYHESEDAQGRAEATAARIQHLIDKGE